MTTSSASTGATRAEATVHLDHADLGPDLELSRRQYDLLTAGKKR
jgi:hypothetical protein